MSFTRRIANENSQKQHPLESRLKVKNPGPLFREPGLVVSDTNTGSGNGDVRREKTFGALLDFELNRVPLVQALESIS